MLRAQRNVLPLVARLKSRLLDLSPKEASFLRRRFPGINSPSRSHLERVITTFIEGYNLAVVEDDMIRLSDRLDSSFSASFLGFAYEGAGLYFALTDLLLPRSASRLKTFTGSIAPRHDFITVIGAGFVIARVPFGLRRLENFQKSLDPLNAWCVADGYGFHQGFFHWKRFIENSEAPPDSLAQQNRSLFDAGVGRAMWWVFGADARAIAAAISRADSERRAEMWAGIGTAVAYAGGMLPQSGPLLLDLTREYRLDFLSGIPFAAHMRHKGHNPADWTDEACAGFLNLSVAQTSEMIMTELNAFLKSCQGSEADKWNRCYLALRERVRRRLN